MDKYSVEIISRAQQLGEEEALNLYKAMLNQTIHKAKALSDIQTYGFYDGNIEALDNHFGVSLFRQNGEDFGERMLNAFIQLFALGFKMVCLIGSDSPTLPEQYIYDAFGLLAKYDLVLGPCQDGGYYLIGLRTPMPELFLGVPWGGSDVFALTIKKASVLNLSYYLLPVWYDIDRPEDLHYL